MRIVVYGNSHVAAWRDAWAGMAAEVPGVDMAFFSLPERIRQRYRIRANGLFAPRRSVTPDELARVAAMNEGRTSCEPGAADVAVCVGAVWYPERAMEMAALGEPPDRTLPPADGRPVFGPGFVQAALDQTCAAALAEWQVSGGGARRPIVFGRPVYAVTCLQATHRLYAPWAAAAAFPGAAAWFAWAYRDRLVAHAAERGVDFIAPPDAVHGELGLTQAGYLAEGGGVVDPQNRSLRGDHSHMNGAYGRACIRHVLAGLDMGTGGPG